MAITVYIDLSAKLEQWTQASAIAMANDDICRVHLVPSKVKQQSRQRIREQYGSTTVQYRLIAVLTYIVVQDLLPTLDYIVIDRDYAGGKAEGTIKNILLDLIRIDRPTATAGMIQFQNVKGSRADRSAKAVYDKKMQPDRILKYREIAQYLKK